jgi:HK97 family phage major capsid protein
MAAKLNELKQKAIEARKALDALQDEHSTARSAYAVLLEQQAAGTLKPDDAGLKAAAEKVAAFDSRLSAQRRLATMAAEAVTAEESALAAEDKDLAEKPSGRVTVEANHEKDKKRHGFRSHRDFLMSVMANCGLRDRSQVSDERLKPLAVFDKEDKQAGGELAYMLPHAFTPPSVRATAGSDEQGEYDDRYGGFAVSTTRLPGVLEVGFEGDPTIGLTQPIPMQSPSVEIMARVDKDHRTSVSGGFTVTRKPETVAATSSRAQLEMVTMKASSLFGLGYASEELLTDSPMSFVAIIETGFRTQFGAHMLNEKLRGKGGNEYLGVLSALAGSGLGPTISIAKEAGQVADTIVANNVLKARARVWGYDQAIWIANHDTFPQLATMSIGVGTAGVLIYSQGNSDRPSTLLGRPIIFSEYASKLGDQGDIGCYNFSQFLDGLYQPLQSAESVHVRFVNHERTFKLWLRNAGAPWWREALTPAKSSDTLSPFVVVDAR